MSDWTGFWIGLGIYLGLSCIGDGIKDAAEKVVDHLKWKERQ